MLVTILAIQAVDSLIGLSRLKRRWSGGRLLGPIVDIGKPSVNPFIAALKDEDKDKEV